MDTILASLLHLRSENAHEDALRIMLELGIQAVDAEEGSALMLERESDELVFVMTAGDMLSESELKGQRVPVGQGLTGMAAQTGEVQIGAPSLGSVNQPIHHGVRAPTQLIAAPMLSGKSVVGVLTAATYKPERQFSINQKRMFERVATLAGLIFSDGKLGSLGATSHQAVGTNLDAARDDLSHEIAQVTQRIGRGDVARLRALLTLLRQVEQLG